MSDITPSQSMNNPHSQTIPELRYDSAGNAYARDHLGNWRPHPGIVQVVTRVLHSEDSFGYNVSLCRSLTFAVCTYHFAATCCCTLDVRTYNSCQLLAASLLATTLTIWVSPCAV
jgi:hypothetical protein